MMKVGAGCFWLSLEEVGEFLDAKKNNGVVKIFGRKKK
jgi:hypothetical protein